MPSKPWNNQRWMREHGTVAPAGTTTPRRDGALQAAASSTSDTPTVGLGFAGVGQGDYGYLVDAAPPDTTGAVGATQYVQWVNESFAVFNKSNGSLVSGFPKRGNTLWTGFGGGCEVNNDGDPIVEYDKVAQRWVLTQFSVTSPTRYGYLQCVAVSKTSDATGAYNRYAYSYGSKAFNDYPKVGVWPDAYYVSYNIFNGNTFAGAKVCAMDRAKMLTGAAATQVCFNTSNAYGGLLPSDLDGTSTPAAGTPNVVAAFGNNRLDLWKFHVDFSSPNSSTFTGPTVLPVDAFSEACGGGTCIPQLGTTQQLDSLADRLMYRLVYRKFADHQSWVVTHSVAAGGAVGVRWYELRDLAGSPSVFQQGTYAPDASSRWMSSAAMDGNGNIAVGYSLSGPTRSPTIAFSTHTAGAALGQLSNETLPLNRSTGSQLTSLARWGDYSTMTVDPVDDCTFWYSTEYLKSNGTFNWSTWITSFRLPSCTPPPPPPPPAPTGLTATAGSGHVTLTWNASPNATSYSVYRTTGTSPAAVTTGLTTTSYDDLGLANGTSYTYTVTATGSAESGPSNSVTATPRATPPAPVARFLTACASATCSFDASTSSDATSWSWAYGDGKSGSGVKTSHSYLNAGAYTVKLTVAASSGSDTMSSTISCSGKRNRVTCTG